MKIALKFHVPVFHTLQEISCQRALLKGRAGPGRDGSGQPGSLFKLIHLVLNCYKILFQFFQIFKGFRAV